MFSISKSPSIIEIDANEAITVAASIPHFSKM
jgi:hypothetical protein